MQTSSQPKQEETVDTTATAKTTATKKYCDCHVHVIGKQTAYPMQEDRHYTPDVADTDALQVQMQRSGVERVVLVQPSVYGTDNRCLLDAIKVLGNAARGVAVIAPDTPDHALEQLADQHIKGLRLNLESSGQRDFSQAKQIVAAWLPAMRRLGMHLQVYAAFDTIYASFSWLDRLEIPIVLDHFAMIPADTPLDDPRIHALCSRLKAGQYYVKLSAPYRITSDDATTQEHVTLLAKHLIQANPQRCLWGSDWPHTNREPGRHRLEVSRYRDIPHERLAKQWSDWMPDDATRSQILHMNPKGLYGFADELRRNDPTS